MLYTRPAILARLSSTTYKLPARIPSLENLVTERSKQWRFSLVLLWAHIWPADVARAQLCVLVSWCPLASRMDSARELREILRGPANSSADSIWRRAWPRSPSRRPPPAGRSAPDDGWPDMDGYRHRAPVGRQWRTGSKQAGRQAGRASVTTELLAGWARPRTSNGPLRLGRPSQKRADLVSPAAPFKHR